MEVKIEVIEAMEVKWGFELKGRRRSNQTRDAQIYREKIDDWVGRAGGSSALLFDQSSYLICNLMHDRYDTRYVGT